MKRDKNYYERLAESLSYDRLYSQRPWRIYLHRLRRLESIKREVIDIGRRMKIGIIADIGCGEGHLLPFLSEQATLVIGVDLSSKRLERSKKNTHGKEKVVFVCSDACRLPLKNSSVDVIACSELIEHLPNPTDFLEGLSAVLRPGGRIILSTPSRFSVRELCIRLAKKLYRFACRALLMRHELMDNYHISLMSPRNLKSIFGQFFYIKKIYTVGLYLPLFTELFFYCFSKTSWVGFYTKVDTLIGSKCFNFLNWNIIVVGEKQD